MNMPDSVQADFDRLALLPQGGFDHNAYYHRWLLKSLPSSMGEALDLGCGTGGFARLLAARADRVLALDFSANMIAAARKRSADTPNIEFLQADVLTWDWPQERFDCVASIATLHHLPLETVLVKAKGALRRGGTMILLDLRRTATVAEWLLLNSLAVPVSALHRLFYDGRVMREASERRAWNEHARTDRYLTVEEVRRACLPILPGAVVRRRLLWRYSLIWRKP
jgi:ubiquinone/menaquinone biosynthesis C-methylase UbiE